MANNLIRRFTPFSDIGRFDPFHEFENFFKDFKPAVSEMEMEPRIKMDVAENEQAYTVKAEIPGVRKEDIKVAIDGNQISISAECKGETDEKEKNLVRSERYYGKQSRYFSLAHAIDEAKAEAKYQDGVLHLNLPKKEGSTGGKRLEIQ